MIIPILIVLIVLALIVVVLIIAKGSNKKDTSGKKLSNTIQKKGSSAVIKDLEKKLSHDPHNVNALQTLGNLYFEEKNWEKVWSIYKTLYDISSAHPEVDIAFCTQKMGIAAFFLQKYDEAGNALLLSGKKNPDSFDTNFYLGRTFYEKKIFDKAAICFKKARLISQGNSSCNEYLGLSLFHSQKYRDCLPYLKATLDEHPDNKELLYNMAVAMGECGMGDKALKVFIHLRPDPQFGALSCLEAGKMHERSKDFKAAISDYEIALKLQNIPEQTLLQIKYRCANDYIAINNISAGLTMLKSIQAQRTGYKDVEALVTRYSELNQNQNLQVYLLSGTSDFVALCRKIIQIFYKDAFVKVEDVSVASESIEIICSIESNKWEAKSLFRFYRTQTVIGDIYVREFHSKMRDAKCDNGVCITMGSFSEGAHKYTEGRPVDLIEKEQLSKMLKKINIMN